MWNQVNIKFHKLKRATSHGEYLLRGLSISNSDEEMWLRFQNFHFRIYWNANPRVEHELLTVDGIRRDAAALAEFWAWLEEEVHKTPVTEVEASDKLLEFRSKQSGFLDTSFDTISGMAIFCSLIHTMNQNQLSAILKGP